MTIIVISSGSWSYHSSAALHTLAAKTFCMKDFTQGMIENVDKTDFVTLGFKIDYIWISHTKSHHLKSVCSSQVKKSRAVKKRLYNFKFCKGQRFHFALFWEINYMSFTMDMEKLFVQRNFKYG